MSQLCGIIVGKKCYVCRSSKPIHLGLLMDNRIEAYCDNCFYCIPQKNRLKITGVEDSGPRGPMEFEYILEWKNE